MRVDLINQGRKIDVGLAEDAGICVLEIRPETDTEKSILASIERNEGNILVTCTTDGSVLRLYKEITK